MIRRLFATIAGCALGVLLTAGHFLIAGPVPLQFASVLGTVGLVGLIVRWRRPGCVSALSLALILLALSNIVPWPAPALVRDAARIAGGMPYCIQVAEGGDYRQASSWLDFSPSNMHAMIRSDRAMQFHAILAVGSGEEPTIYNWSYRSMRWRKDPLANATPVISCAARQAFATDLPYLPRTSTRDQDVAALPQEPGVMHMRLAGRSFTIPASYQPMAHAAYNAYLRLIVDVPSVQPMACADVRSCINHWVEIYLTPASVMSWLDGPATEKTRLVDDGAGPNGPVRTRIDCYPPSFNDGLNCTQHFLFDGVLFRFQMREADLSDWRSAQDRLIVLFLDLQKPQ
jgi:hypothetical protein